MPQLSQAFKRRLNFAVGVVRQNKLNTGLTILERKHVEEAIMLNNELTPKVMTEQLDVNTYDKKQKKLLSTTIVVENIVKKYTNVRC